MNNAPDDQITQRKKAENLFQALLEAAPDAMMIVDQQGSIELVNTQTETIFGYTREELVGQPIELLIPERFVSLRAAHIDGYIADPHVRGGVGLELYARRKDGSQFPVEISLSPIETEEGVLIASAVRDVTEWKRAEESLARLAAIVESSDDAIITEALDGTITSWNTGAERIFGYSAAEMIGQPVDRLFLPGRENEEPEILDRLIRGEKVDHFDSVRVTKDGHHVPVSLTISPVKDASGHIIGASKIARDISERKQAEDEIHRLNTELEQRVLERTTHLTSIIKELDAFNYSVSHDLRTPLRAMDGFALAIQEDYADKLGDKGHHYLERIRAASQHMGHLIDDLLRLSRLSRAEMAHKPVDLSSLAREIVAELKEVQPEHQVECIIEEGLIVSGDARLLRAALQNLLGNAWKFTGKQPHPRIELGMTQHNGIQAYFVRDNGAGFDMKYVNKLFRAFQRLHDVTEFEGTGIGLATVQRIIQRHGGEVWAESAVDRGATFYFTL